MIYSSSHSDGSYFRTISEKRNSSLLTIKGEIDTACTIFIYDIQILYHDISSVGYDLISQIFELIVPHIERTRIFVRRIISSAFILQFF